MYRVKAVSQVKLVNEMKPLKTVKLVNRVLPCTLACVAVGDEESDPALMEFLGAEMKKESGQFFKVDIT